MRKDFISNSLFFSFVLSSSVLYGLYTLFYYYSPVIWSFNIKLPLDEYAPWVRWCVLERDGIEGYVLYMLMFLNILFALLLDKLFFKINSDFFKKFIFLFFAAASVFFYTHVGFHPPLSEISRGFSYIIFMISTLFITLFLSVCFIKSRRITNFFVAFLLIPICLISVESIHLGNYAYIFSPALRIIHGLKPNETYFQYDYLLSLLAAAWMKLHISIYYFKILGQISYYALFIGVYLFAQKYFIYKRHALYLLISMVIIKIYALMSDPVFLFQVVPLRLDLWLIILMLTYYKGAHNRLVGFMLGFLVVLHHSFGFIYSCSYLLFVVILCFFEMVTQRASIKEILRRYYSLYSQNIIILIISSVIYMIFFGSPVHNTAVFFQKNGLGFLPIAKNSFYWLMPPLLSLVFILIIRNRKQLSNSYFQTSIFLVILTVGNSLYFFGRSHEHNIINISGVLLFSLFLLFDLSGLELQKNSSFRISKLFIPLFSIIIVLGAAHCYSGRAINRIKQQFVNFQRRDFFVINKVSFDAQNIAKLTRSSKKIILLSMLDFYYYWHGGYTPSYYYGLTEAWIFKKDFVDFLNTQLINGYYLVIPVNEYAGFSAIINALIFKNIKEDSNFVFIYNEPI